MKQLIILLSFTLFCINIQGQVYPSTTENYIVSTKYMQEGAKGRAIYNIQYYDGLGRPSQQNQVRVLPNECDLISLQEYDSLGRESKIWLPIPHDDNGNEGAYVSTNELSFLSEYQYIDQLAFSYPVYESSPLSRVVKQYGPGQEWHNNTRYVGTQYLTNNTREAKLNCAYFKTIHVSTDNISLSRNGNYPTGQLFVTEIKDEDDNYSYEFKDKLGQVVLTRQINNKDYYDTYYVYDDFGNLSYVLPPMLSDQILKEGKSILDDGVEMKQYAYMYKYDSRNRCIKKLLPGCEPIYYVYDKANRLIFSQDGEQRKQNEWSFTIPDKLGRTVLTGTCKTINNIPITIGRFNDFTFYAQYNTGNYKGYGLKAENTASGINMILNDWKIFTASFYDNYNFLPTGSRMHYSEQNGYGKKQSSAKGLLTISLVTIPNEQEDIVTAMYYDEKGRIIQTKSNNHMGGLEEEFISYNFTGQPVARKIIHTGNYLYAPSKELIEEYTYNYDHAERLKETIRNGKVIESLEYNELGQLKNKNQGNTLANTFEYNIRGWIKKHTEANTEFEQALFYTESSSGQYKNYNGNISYMTYKQGIDHPVKNSYIYDGLNRMTQSTANITSPGYEYNTSEEYMEYDKHGNIRTLFRGTNNTWTDMMSLSYKGNQLSSLNNEYPDINGVNVVEYPTETGSFTYNTNGALTSDSGRGIATIQYNSLNLPELIQFNNGNQIYNTYSANGTRLKTKHITAKQGVVQPIINGEVRTLTANEISATTTTNYIGNIIYSFTTRNKIIGYAPIKVLFNGGYELYDRYGSDIPQTYYQLTDYLGNIRSTIDAEDNANEVTEYHAFGAPFRRFNREMSSDPYKFGGKEFDRMHGLDWYDFDARQYDPVLSRFHTMDPLAEKYYNITPYAYCANNPLKFIDPTGMAYQSTNPNQWAGLLNHLSSGNSLDSFNTSDWDEVDDPDPSLIAQGMAGPPSHYWMSEIPLEQRQQVGIYVTRYFTPLEDMYGVFSGEDLEGNNYNRWEAAGWSILAIFPISKLAKVGKGFSFVSKAVRISLSKRVGKRGYTVVGYHFQKHSDRFNSAAWLKFIPKGSTLNPDAYNKAGYEAFKEIWRAPGNFQKVGNFIEKRLPDGRGIRLQDDGVFKGFLD